MECWPYTRASRLGASSNPAGGTGHRGGVEGPAITGAFFCVSDGARPSHGDEVEARALLAIGLASRIAFAGTHHQHSTEQIPRLHMFPVQNLGLLPQRQVCVLCSRKSQSRAAEPAHTAEAIQPL
jgi:hypothetical protein